MSNLNKYDTDKWTLYVNQSKNSTAGLDDGVYTYQAHAKNIRSNWNQTEIRTITIGEIDWSQCGIDITQSGSYTMDDDITDCVGTAIDIQIADVELNCAGHTIDGTDALNDVGIIDSCSGSPEETCTNVTIFNCTFTDHNYTSINWDSDGLYFYNSTCDSTESCIYATYGEDNIIHDIVIKNMQPGANTRAIYMSNNDNISIYNIDISNYQGGFYSQFATAGSGIHNITNITAENISGIFFDTWYPRDNYITNSWIQNCSVFADITDEAGGSEVDVYIYNNYINCSTHIQSSSGFSHASSEIILNTSNQTGTRPSPMPGSHPSLIGGNYWTDPDGNFSDTCTDANPTSWQYQEDADATTCEDNFCDGDWGTSGSNALMNYTKPVGAVAASVWQIKDASGTTNLTILESCWDYNETTLLLQKSGAVPAVWQCYDGSWQNLEVRTNPGYEEAMWWGLNGIGDGFCDSGYTPFQTWTDELPYSDEYSAVSPEPDINLSFGPPGTTSFEVRGCGPAIQNYSAMPTGQTLTYGIDYVCNNGSAAGNIYVYLSGAPATDWEVFASNSSSYSWINLTENPTTPKLLYSNLVVDACTYVWFNFTCINVVDIIGIYEKYNITAVS
jgi:hypothetical protein